MAPPAASPAAVPVASVRRLGATGAQHIPSQVQHAAPAVVPEATVLSVHRDPLDLRIEQLQSEVEALRAELAGRS